MKRFWAFYQKEMRFLFRQPLTFIFLILAIILNNWLAFSVILVNRQSTLQPLWQNLPFFFMFLAPLVSLVLINEEKQNNREELIRSLPLSTPFILANKLIAAFSLLFILLLASTPLAGMLFWLDHPDKGILLGGYLGGSILLLAYLLASFFFNISSRYNLSGFFLGFLFLLGDDLLGQNFFLLHFPQLGSWFRYLSFRTHYQHLGDGFLSLSDVIFFLTWFIIFWLSTIIVQKRKRQ